MTLHRQELLVQRLFSKEKMIDVLGVFFTVLQPSFKELLSNQYSLVYHNLFFGSHFRNKGKNSKHRILINQNNGSSRKDIQATKYYKRENIEFVTCYLFSLDFK